MAKKDRFNYFASYEQLTKLAVREADLLVESMRAFKSADGLSETIDLMHTYENEGDSINHDIFQNAATDFMPPIDREDVVELAHELDNVLDYIDDVLGHMYMYDIHVMPKNAIAFAELIKKSAQALDALMNEFHNFKKSKQLKEFIVNINSYEEEADHLYKDAIRHLHTEDNDDVMHVLVWSRIYDRMEKCCDATEHAADIVSTIVLKNI